MNDYYNPPNTPVNYTLARSGAIRAQFAAIGAAFDKFPAIAAIREMRVTYGEAAGTANGLLVTLDPAPEAYNDGLSLKVKVGTTNTGAATINVNGLGAVAILNRAGANVGAGALIKNSVAELVFTAGAFRLLNDGTEIAAAAGSATAAAASANAAAASEVNALGYANTSEAARDVSVAAKDTSVAAKTASEAARDISVAAKDTSVSAKDASVAAQGLSEAARDASVTAKNASVTAQGLSEAARNTSQTHANSAAGSATAAGNAQVAAETARDQTLSLLDNFDDRYLGAKAAPPTVDNDGDPLVAGSLFYRTTAPVGMHVYTGSAWVAAYVAGDMLLPIAGGEMTGGLKLVAAAAAMVPLMFQDGSDPTAPPNGSMWWAASSGYRIRHGNATDTLLGATRAQTVTNKTFTGYTETVVASVTGAALSPNLANGTIFPLSTNANATITLPSPVAGQSFVIPVTYGGAHTITWAGGARKWADGTAPTPTSVSGKIDVFTFICVGEANWLAFASGQNL